MSEVSNAPAPSEAPAESSGEVSQELSSEESFQDSSQEGIESSAEEVVENIAEAVENGEITEKEAKNLIRKFKLKIDGKEVEREVDLGDDEFLRNQLQLAEVSKKRMSETAEMKKLLGLVESQLKQDPWQVLQQLGMDPDQLAEMRIQQRIEEMKKSPEQIEREKIQKELEDARNEAKRLKEEKEAIEFSKMQEQAAVEIESEITRALDAHKSLPKSRHVVKRIADSMLWAMNNGYEDVTADDVIPMVEKDLRDELNRFMEEMPEDLLESYIGKKTTEKLRAKRLQSIQPKSINQIKPTAKSIEPQENKESKKIPAKDFFKRLGK